MAPVKSRLISSKTATCCRLLAWLKWFNCGLFFARRTSYWGLFAKLELHFPFRQRGRAPFACGAQKYFRQIQNLSLSVLVGVEGQLKRDETSTDC
eukprot:1391557-Amphidinium_carterae.1